MFLCSQGDELDARALAPNLVDWQRWLKQLANGCHAQGSVATHASRLLCTSHAPWQPVTYDALRSSPLG